MQHSIDTICRGVLVLAQPARSVGYRFNVDSVILADFTARALDHPVDLALDFGAGCGIVGLLLMRTGMVQRVRLVEIQQELAQLARDNTLRNDLSSRAEVVQADLRQVDLWHQEPAQLVVSNPPFFARGAGRVNDHESIALARHEVACSLDELVHASSRVLAVGGMLSLIHLHNRRDEVRRAMERHGFSLSRTQRVLPLPDRPAARVLMLGLMGSPPRCHPQSGGQVVEELEPLVVETRPGVYSPRLREMLGEGRAEG